MSGFFTTSIHLWFDQRGKNSRNLPEDLDYAFHLACYHGKTNPRSPIHLRIMRIILLTSLKLFERLSRMKNLSKVVRAAAGCAVAKKNFEEAEATFEDAPVSLFHDSPYSISKLIGEMYGNYFWSRSGLPIVS